MRKTTEELWQQALNEQSVDADVPETFRRLCIENERECAKAVAFVDGFRSAGLHFDSHGLPVGTHLFTFPPAVQVPEGWKDVAVELPKDGQLIIGCNKDNDTWTEVWDSEEPIGGTRWWIAALEAENKSLKELFTVGKDGTTMADRYLDLKAENARLTAMLPDPASLKGCTTIQDYRFAAMYYESQWRSCSHDFNTVSSRNKDTIAQQAERIKELERAISTDTETIVKLHEQLAAADKLIKELQDALI